MRGRAIVWSLAIICAASRFLAMARSLWDWDEALFCLAMRDYDVSVHHPHPPGFPAYIAMARVARIFTDTDFRALQIVNLLAAVLVFPAVYLLARELKFRFETCVIAATLFAFFPNVWFFGGGAFSDVPSIVLVCFAATFLLRGVDDRNAYWLGTLLLAIAIGMRPQNLLLGLFPGILATRKRRPFEIVVALLIGVLVVGAAFGGAVYATGSWPEYLRVVREHGDYISRVDSFRSPERPQLWRLFDRFFIKQYQSSWLSVITSVFVLISAFGAFRDRDRSMLRNVLIFGPFAIFAWLMLDRFSISRFSIGYQPMFAILAADGIRRVALWGGGLSARRIDGRAKSAPLHEIALAGALAIAFAVYTIPALNVVRTTVSPSVLAAEAVSMHVLPTDSLYVAHTMSKFVDLLVPGMTYRRVIDDRSLPLAKHDRAWLLAELNKIKPEGFIFQRDRGALWNISRRHYFEIVLKPLREVPQFGAGWYDTETDDIHEWRWMGARSVALLPPQNGETLLRIGLGIPAETMGANPQITVKINGKVIDQFHTTAGYIERDVHVTPAPATQPNVLELSIDRTVNPFEARTGPDRRTLGLRLRYLAWGPA
ncbi:MAG TPA: glycosyltransferase family 39 protein [Thermoanaerobaculia bacterium]